MKKRKYKVQHTEVTPEKIEEILKFYSQRRKSEIKPIAKAVKEIVEQIKLSKYYQIDGLSINQVARKFGVMDLGTSLVQNRILPQLNKCNATLLITKGRGEFDDAARIYTLHCMHHILRYP